jgi:predicted secreted protein
VELGPSDTDGDRVVAVGEDIVVVLPESPGSGHRWFLDEGPPPLADHYEPASAGAGGTGRRELRFRAEHPGAFDLRLVRRRAWEDRADAEFRVRIEVRASPRH